jgi:thiamine biosynthesis lipoprotein
MTPLKVQPPPVIARPGDQLARRVLFATLLVLSSAVASGSLVDRDPPTPAAGAVSDPRPIETSAPHKPGIERRHFSMGTWLGIRVEAASRSRAVNAAEAAIRAVETAEARLSTWRTGTELSDVNARLATASIKLSAALARDLTTAMYWHRETRGAFNPGVGSLVAAWDLRGNGRIPGVRELMLARNDASMSGVEITGNVLTLGNSRLRFEEGGFGKGVGLAEARSAALENGAACVILDFGGQVAVGGDCGPVSIGVADPDDRAREVAVLELAGAGAATSGLSERAVVVNGRRYGHIIDPRTGLPSTDWGSVTVVSPDPVTADILATALYVMGPSRGYDWIVSNGTADAVFAERLNGRLELTVTPCLAGRLKILDPKIRLLPPPFRRTQAQHD